MGIAPVLTAAGTLLIAAVAAAQDGAKPWDPALGTSELKGVVQFSGKAPKRRPVDMGADETCSQMHGKRPLDETVIVNPNGTLRNVFVWVKKGLEGWKFPVPAEVKVLDQRGCTYSPHVFGIMAGQDLKILNSDDTLHNIHAQPKLNSELNFGQPKKGMEEIRKFSNPEIMIKFKCDVHGWMGAYAGVTAHPYYAVTGEDGSFRLPMLPPGDYTIGAWHEKYETKPLTVKVGDKEAKYIAFTFGE